jgi:hypothetical protein
MGYGLDPTNSFIRRPRQVIGYLYNWCNPNDSSLGPVELPGFANDPGDAARFVSPAGNGQVNNIGVPGIRVADYPVVGYGSINPYAARFYNDPTTTPFDELWYRMHNLHPTFFTMWLGANDILGYALAGGQGNGYGTATPAISNIYSSNDITPVGVFETNYDSAVHIAVSTGATGALINIPDITSIPFFTTIPINGLTITRQSLADSLNRFYGNSTNYSFKMGANCFVIQQHDGTTRQSVLGELILLTCPSDSIACNGWGSFKPIPAKYVISTDEKTQIQAFTSTFNTHIAQMAALYNLTLVDMNTYMTKLSSGIVYDGIHYTAQYITGGAFSLDGIHLTPRGYALVANQIIQSINAHYHSTVPEVDANKYNGVLFP